jgi:hypothetical protein
VRSSSDRSRPHPVNLRRAGIADTHRASGIGKVVVTCVVPARHGQRLRKPDGRKSKALAEDAVTRDDGSALPLAAWIRIPTM